MKIGFHCTKLPPWLVLRDLDLQQAKPNLPETNQYWVSQIRWGYVESVRQKQCASPVPLLLVGMD